MAFTPTQNSIGSTDSCGCVSLWSESGDLVPFVKCGEHRPAPVLADWEAALIATLPVNQRTGPREAPDQSRAA